MSAATALIGPSRYVVQTKPKQELRALEQLENQGYNCFSPTLKTEKLRRGRPEIVTEPLFARYLFIRLDTVTSNWAPLRSTRGVSNLLPFGGRFATVSDLVIDALQSGEERQQHAPLFEISEKAVVESGPFAGLEGIYQMTESEARALVLIEIIHRPQQVMFRIDVLRKWNRRCALAKRLA